MNFSPVEWTIVTQLSPPLARGLPIKPLEPAIELTDPALSPAAVNSYLENRTVTVAQQLPSVTTADFSQVLR
jgi:hypothetical protein